MFCFWYKEAFPLQEKVWECKSDVLSMNKNFLQEFEKILQLNTTEQSPTLHLFSHGYKARGDIQLVLWCLS